MTKTYPNLPLIEERFKNIIKDEIIAKKNEVTNKTTEEGRYPFYQPGFVVEVFLQHFPNTAGLFQRPGTISGQAMSSYYITVIHETTTDIYGVFQSNDPVYKVTDANENFFEDLHEQRMADLGTAELRY